MGLFGVGFECRYPVFGFENGCRAMTADEIMEMQLQQMLNQQAAANSKPEIRISEKDRINSLPVPNGWGRSRVSDHWYPPGGPWRGYPEISKAKC